jgi:hypothetical protein
MIVGTMLNANAAVTGPPFVDLIDGFADKYERGEDSREHAFACARMLCAGAPHETLAYLCDRFDAADRHVAHARSKTPAVPPPPPPVHETPPATVQGETPQPPTSVTRAIGGRFYGIIDAAPLRGQTVAALHAEIRRSPQERVGNDIRVDLGSGWFSTRTAAKKRWRIWIPLGGTSP